MLHSDTYGLLFGGFFLRNIASFLVMFWDKSFSRKKNAQRISEGMMFFLATMFGSVGIFLGMFALRHKTRKWYFMIGVPFLIVQNIALFFVLYLLFQGGVSE